MCFQCRACFPISAYHSTSNVIPDIFSLIMKLIVTIVTTYQVVHDVYDDMVYYIVMVLII